MNNGLDFNGGFRTVARFAVSTFIINIILGGAFVGVAGYVAYHFLTKVW